MMYRNDWLKLRFKCFFTIQSRNYYFQLNNHLTWFAFVVIFLTEPKKQIRNKVEESTFTDSDLFDLSSISFKNITVSLKKSSSSGKNVIVEEELDCIDTYNIGNLEDSARLVFINGECGNLIVANGGGELTENISQKRQTFYDNLQMSTQWQMLWARVFLQ